MVKEYCVDLQSDFYFYPREVSPTKLTAAQVAILRTVYASRDQEGCYLTIEGLTATFLGAGIDAFSTALKSLVKKGLIGKVGRRRYTHPEIDMSKFIKIPRALDKQGLSILKTAILTYVLEHTWQSKGATPGQTVLDYRSISSVLSLSPSRLFQAIKELIAEGFLECVNSKKVKQSVSHIVKMKHPDLWPDTTAKTPIEPPDPEQILDCYTSESWIVKQEILDRLTSNLGSFNKSLLYRRRIEEVKKTKTQESKKIEKYKKIDLPLAGGLKFFSNGVAVLAAEYHDWLKAGDMSKPLSEPLRLFVLREANGAADPNAYCMHKHRHPHISQGKSYSGIIGKFIKEGGAMEKPADNTLERYQAAKKEILAMPIGDRSETKIKAITDKHNIRDDKLQGKYKNNES